MSKIECWKVVLKKSEGGRGLLSIEEFVIAKTKSQSENKRRQRRTKEEPMLKELRRKKILPEEEMKEEYQWRMHVDRTKEFTQKSLHGKFRKSTEATAGERL